jgi:hypothetical protein
LTVSSLSHLIFRLIFLLEEVQNRNAVVEGGVKRVLGVGRGSFAPVRLIAYTLGFWSLEAFTAAHLE